MSQVDLDTNTGIYTFTGPGFYAKLISNTNRVIEDIGYISTTARIRSKQPLVTNAAALEAIFGGKLPAFLFTLHQAGVELANPDIQHDLDGAIQDAGLDFVLDQTGYNDGEYDFVEALDFSVLTGRKDYPFLRKHMKLPENADENEPSGFKITDRPELQEVPNGTEDLFLDTIKHLGLSGIIARMYAREAMTWEEYLECANHFWSGNPTRVGMELGRVQFLLPRLLRPPLTQDKKAQLLSIAAGVYVPAEPSSSEGSGSDGDGIDINVGVGL